jgi:hypothetical protein
MRENEIKLKEILSQELDLYEQTLELAKRKTEVLKESKLTELELITLEEREKVEKISRIDREREEIVKGLAESLGVNERLDLSTMSENFTEEAKEGFLKLKEEFKVTIEKLKQVNSLNDTLIKDSLEYIDFSLNIMSAATVDGNYSGSLNDERENTNKRSLFDLKA